MSEAFTKIPGIKAKHAIITPGCIQGRGIDGAVESTENPRRVACLYRWVERPRCNYVAVTVSDR